MTDTEAINAIARILGPHDWGGDQLQEIAAVMTRVRQVEYEDDFAKFTEARP